MSNKEKLEKLIATVLSDGTMAEDLAQMGRRVFLSRAEALRHMGRGARR